MGELSRLSEDFREQAHEAIQFYGYSSPLFRRVTGIDFDIAELYRILDRHDPMHVTRIARDMEKCLSSSRLWSQLDDPDPTDPTLISFEKLLKGAPDIWPLLSVHPDGHVREAAVAAVEKIRNSFTLALLLLRLNDWVPAVRDAAIKTVTRLSQEPPDRSGIEFECVIDCLELMLAPERFERTKGSARNALEALITNPHISTLIRAFILHDKTDRAPEFARSIFAVFPSKDFIERCAYDAAQPRVRLKAARFIGSHITAAPFISSPPAFIRIMENFLSDPNPILNREALDYLIENPDCDLNQATIIAPFLKTNNIGLIRRAITLLSRLGYDWKADLEICLSEGRLNRAQLLNWQRSGSKKDAAKILSMADKQSKISKVRILGSTAQMGNKNAAQSLIEFVQASSDRQTIRSAALYLHKCGELLTAGDLSCLAVRGHDISYKPFKWHVEAMPAAELSTLIASLIKTAPAQPIEPFWQLIGRKLDASPSPIQSRQRDALLKPLAGLPEAQDRMHAVLDARNSI